jgi:hypothetical protein
MANTDKNPLSFGTWRIALPLSDPNMGYISKVSAGIVQWDLASNGRADIVAIELQSFYYRSGPFFVLIIDVDKSYESCQIWSRTSMNLPNHQNESNFEVPKILELHQSLLIQAVLGNYFGNKSLFEFHRYYEVINANQISITRDPVEHCKNFDDVYDNSDIKFDLIVESIDCSITNTTQIDHDTRLQRVFQKLRYDSNENSLYILYNVDNSCFGDQDYTYREIYLPVGSMIKCCPAIIGKICRSYYYYDGNRSSEYDHENSFPLTFSKLFAPKNSYTVCFLMWAGSRQHS